MQLFLCFLISLVFYVHGVAAEQGLSLKNDPSLLLNPQDVPIFYENNPLTKMVSFTVVTAFPFKNGEMEEKTQQAIHASLKKIGDVVRLSDNDMRGFGAGNILLIQMGNVTDWIGKETPVSRISLSIETSASLSKTGIKTFPIVWSINTFLQGASENNVIAAVQKLMDEFVQSYQYANRDQKKRPVFYSYSTL
jgi:hypothetical protein